MPFVGAGIAIIAGVHSVYRLSQWYSAGTLWANFRSRGERSHHQLITFGDHPFNFVGLFGLHLLFILFGCLGFVFIAREMRAWLKRDKSGG
jgi:hypothetical protein